ncbi:MAG: PhzF family phenazine biosynthesis protein [Bacillota bacterium]|nr:PhzF family phenazine biosynthesis protein [Bacillota bacterium]
MSHPFYIVDVFAEKKYVGNQLAVICDADSLTTEEMQKVALEMNYSETTFIISDQPRNGGYDVRIFSLDEELPFAGHPTLGTAYIIQQQLISRDIPELKLNLPVGQITVTFSYKNGKPHILWMRQVAPRFGLTFKAKDAAAVLNIEEEEIDERFPIEEVSTGLPFIIIPLKKLAAIRKCCINNAAYRQLIDKAEAKSIYVFAPETYQPGNDLNTRMFDDFHGIAEDPATGSAAGCLAAYLVKNGYYGKPKVAVRVEQGYEINRPSILFLEAEKTEKSEEISVLVGGRVVATARGELL